MATTASTTIQALIHEQALLRKRYSNFIGGEWRPPVHDDYFIDYSPINGEPLCEVARSSPLDIELALDAAHAAKHDWGTKSPADRAAVLAHIAARMEANLELLAMAETVDNGKPIRETRAADLPLAIDHFRYFAACIRAQEGGLAELDHDTVAYHFKEPIGVVGQIIPWNFPLLMAAWKLAPAIAAGNCVVIKPASNTPVSLLMLMDLIHDLVPPGVINVVTGPGGEVGKALACNSRIGKIAFTGETNTGREIMRYAAEPIVPMTLELGGKSPNIFLADVMDADDEFFDKALEGFTLFAFNKGEVCTCPSRALIQESIFERFLERALERVSRIRMGDPTDPATMMGAQVSREQMGKILAYIKIGRDERAQCRIGGQQAEMGGELAHGNYVQPTVFVGHNNMRIFREEIFGPVLSVTSFKTPEEAVRIANDTVYGLGAGVWSRNGTAAYRLGREIQAGRVWINSYHLYPAGAAFGGYKESGFGRETQRMVLDHYQQTKNLLVSYSPKTLGFF